MTVESHVEHLRKHGYVVAEQMIPRADVEATHVELFDNFPSPEAFAAGERGDLDASATAGTLQFPFAGDLLHRLIVHPELLRFAESAMETSDLRIYQVVLWAKYAGATDYEQALHPDYRNHTLLVPSDEPGVRQLITWILLSDVLPEHGATRIVSRLDSGHLPPRDSYSREDQPELYAREVAAAGPTGSVLAYGPDVLHRGAAFTAPTGGRFTLTVSFRSAEAEWAGNQSWPGMANEPQMMRFLTRCSVRERALFGFPLPGHRYWTTAALQGVATRYPEMDLMPYAATVSR